MVSDFGGLDIGFLFMDILGFVLEGAIVLLDKSTDGLDDKRIGGLVIALVIARGSEKGWGFVEGNTCAFCNRTSTDLRLVSNEVREGSTELTDPKFVSIDRAAEDAEERREFELADELALLNLKKLSRAVFEEDVLV